MNLKERLINGEQKIGVIGIGYIGFSTLAYFAKEGVGGVGYDVDPKKVEAVNSRHMPIEDMDMWLGFGVNFDLIEATTNWEDLKDCNPIFVAVPTEKGTEPWFDALKDTISKISTFEDSKLILIESTLAPNTCDSIVAPLIDNHKVAVVPRRDWYGFGEDRSKTLTVLPRIVGGVDEETTREAMDVLSIVCRKLHPCSIFEAEITKAVENSLREADINFANQLMLAYPSVNIRKVLELAGTKWNIEDYHPGIASPGGYCISMACSYLYWSAENKTPLSIMRAVMNYEPQHVTNVMERIIDKFKPKRVGLLGFSYLGNLKVSTMSACLGIIDFLDAEGISYAVHDPLYSKEELESRDIETFGYPDDVGGFDMLILTAGHDYYKGTRPNYNGIVIDATGIWEKWRNSFGEYVLIGEPF